MASTAYPVLQTRKGNWRSLSYYRIKGLNIPTLNTGDPAKLEQYLDNFQTKSDDVFVASYLKSGKPYRSLFFFSFFPLCIEIAMIGNKISDAAFEFCALE